MSATVDDFDITSEKLFQGSVVSYPICAFFFAMYILGLGLYFLKIWSCRKFGLFQKSNTIERPGLLLQTFVFLWNKCIRAQAKAWLSSQATILYEMSFTRHFIPLYAYGNYADQNYIHQYLPHQFKERFECFQDFFARELRSEPVFHKGQAVVGCEGLLCDKHLISEKENVSIKGDLLRSRDVFGSFASEIPEDYEFINIFLNNRDYHHIHSPIDGQIEAIERVPGDLIVLRPWFYKKNPSLPAIMNERVNIKMIDELGRRCYLSIVGGPVVNSVILPEGLITGSKTRAGQKLASFHLGSTFCLASPFRLEAPVNSRIEIFTLLKDMAFEIKGFGRLADENKALYESVEHSNLAV